MPAVAPARPQLQLQLEFFPSLDSSCRLNRLGLSARAYHRVLKIARTIADLDGAGELSTDHVSEAIPLIKSIR